MLYVKERRKLLGGLMGKKSEKAEAGVGGRGTRCSVGTPRQPQRVKCKSLPTGLDVSTWNVPSQSGRNLVSSLTVKVTCVQCR